VLPGLSFDFIKNQASGKNNQIPTSLMVIYWKTHRELFTRKFYTHKHFIPSYKPVEFNPLKKFEKFS
jgi:hypothetical protein